MLDRMALAKLDDAYEEKTSAYGKRKKESNSSMTSYADKEDRQEALKLMEGDGFTHGDQIVLGSDAELPTTPLFDALRGVRFHSRRSNLHLDLSEVEEQKQVLNGPEPFPHIKPGPRQSRAPEPRFNDQSEPIYHKKVNEVKEDNLFLPESLRRAIAVRKHHWQEGKDIISHLAPKTAQSKPPPRTTNSKDNNRQPSRGADRLKKLHDLGDRLEEQDVGYHCDPWIEIGGNTIPRIDLRNEIIVDPLKNEPSEQPRKKLTAGELVKTAQMFQDEKYYAKKHFLGDVSLIPEHYIGRLREQKYVQTGTFADERLSVMQLHTSIMEKVEKKRSLRKMPRVEDAILIPKEMNMDILKTRYLPDRFKTQGPIAKDAVKITNSKYYPDRMFKFLDIVKVTASPTAGQGSKSKPFDFIPIRKERKLTDYTPAVFWSYNDYFPTVVVFAIHQTKYNIKNPIYIGPMEKSDGLGRISIHSERPTTEFTLSRFYGYIDLSQPLILELGEIYNVPSPRLRADATEFWMQWTEHLVDPVYGGHQYAMTPETRGFESAHRLFQQWSASINLKAARVEKLLRKSKLAIPVPEESESFVTAPTQVIDDDDDDVQTVISFGGDYVQIEATPALNPPAANEDKTIEQPKTEAGDTLTVEHLHAIREVKKRIDDCNTQTAKASTVVPARIFSHPGQYNYSSFETGPAITLSLSDLALRDSIDQVIGANGLRERRRTHPENLFRHEVVEYEKKRLDEYRRSITDELRSKVQRSRGRVGTDEFLDFKVLLDKEDNHFTDQGLYPKGSMFGRPPATPQNLVVPWNYRTSISKTEQIFKDEADKAERQRANKELEALQLSLLGITDEPAPPASASASSKQKPKRKVIIASHKGFTKSEREKRDVSDTASASAPSPSRTANEPKKSKNASPTQTSTQPRKDKRPKVRSVFSDVSDEELSDAIDDILSGDFENFSPNGHRPDQSYTAPVRTSKSTDVRKLTDPLVGNSKSIDDIQSKASSGIIVPERMKLSYDTGAKTESKPAIMAHDDLNFKDITQGDSFYFPAREAKEVSSASTAAAKEVQLPDEKPTSSEPPATKPLSTPNALMLMDDFDVELPETMVKSVPPTQSLSTSNALMLMDDLDGDLLDLVGHLPPIAVSDEDNGTNEEKPTPTATAPLFNRSEILKAKAKEENDENDSEVTPNFRSGLRNRYAATIIPKNEYQDEESEGRLRTAQPGMSYDARASTRTASASRGPGRIWSRLPRGSGTGLSVAGGSGASPRLPPPGRRPDTPESTTLDSMRRAGGIRTQSVRGGLDLSSPRYRA